MLDQETSNVYIKKRKKKKILPCATSRDKQHIKIRFFIYFYPFGKTNLTFLFEKINRNGFCTNIWNIFLIYVHVRFIHVTIL